MPNLLLLTVILPLSAAGCLFLASLLLLKLGIEKGRFGASVFALVVAVAVLTLVVMLKTQDDVTTVLSSWNSSLLAESAVRLGLNAWLWPIGLILSLATCCLVLAELGRRHSASPALAAIWLALLAGGLAAIWSANPLTTIVSWALYDLFMMLGQVVAGGKREGMARRLAFGSMSVLLLWAGVLAAGNGTGSVQWSLMPPGGAKMTWWSLAGLLRLGAYPFHFSTTSTVTSHSALVPTLLLSPVMGWALWIRLVLVSGAVLAESTWIIIPALLTLGVGGFMGWAVKSPHEGRSWIGMGISGAVLLAAFLVSLLGRSQALGEDVALSILTLGAAGWMLGVTVLFLGGSLDSGRALRRETLPRSIPSLLGALSLIGVPPTLGFATESSLMRGLTRVEHWGWRVSFFVGQLFLVAAVTRWLFPSTPPQRSEADDNGLFGRIAHDAGLIVSVLLQLVLGVVPTLLVAGSSRVSLRFLLTGSGLTGWSLWGGALLLGGILGWQDAYLRPRVFLWLDVLQDIVRLDWAWGLLVGAFERGLTALRAVDDVLGGRGALLWSFIMLLILILVSRVR
ncbi:MAG: hypothetical protein PVG71_13910 [Anaerolineae bacterium]|jgi:formate hydrogenlyase subunit 3/multisubunit Na+/H+ antiporter MnhD subunit